MDSCKVNSFSDIEYVFLDRDGVINRKPPASGFVTRWEDFHILPGVEQAIAALNHSGRRVIVVTNQRGIALGLYSTEQLSAIHTQLREHLHEKDAHLDAIYVCPHDVGECNCRKPRTGMFEQAFRDFPQAHVRNSVMIGDSLSDMEAAEKFGMRGVIVTGRTGPLKTETRQAMEIAQASAISLAEFVNRYLVESEVKT